MNWGWKIVVVYGAFVVMTLSMAFFFMRQKVDLVADDYYKQEIEYQGQMDKISNAKSLENPVDISYSMENRAITLIFPGEHIPKGIKGKIHFYRPSNADEDKEFEINLKDSGEQVIGVSSLSKGLWKLKISWTAGGEAYFDEKVVTL